MAQFIEHLTFDVLPLIFEREPGVDRGGSNPLLGTIRPKVLKL
jgi:hypothetical protein